MEDYRVPEEKVRAQLRQYEEELLELWREESLLVMNYRMEVAAKEIERWGGPLSPDSREVEAVLEEVDSLFQ